MIDVFVFSLTVVWILFSIWVFVQLDKKMVKYEQELHDKSNSLGRAHRKIFKHERDLIDLQNKYSDLVESIRIKQINKLG